MNTNDKIKAKAETIKVINESLNLLDTITKRYEDNLKKQQEKTQEIIANDFAAAQKGTDEITARLEATRARIMARRNQK